MLFFFLLFNYKLILFVHDFAIPRVTEAVNEPEKNLGDDKPVGEEGAADGDKETPAGEPEEKEPEEKVDLCFILSESKFLCFCIFWFSMAK